MQSSNRSRMRIPTRFAASTIEVAIGRSVSLCTNRGATISIGFGIAPNLRSPIRTRIALPFDDSGLSPAAASICDFDLRWK